MRTVQSLLGGGGLRSGPAAAVTTYSPWKTAIHSATFVFRVKTASGGIVGNIRIQARDQYEAQNKLMQPYPGWTILNCEVR